MNEFRLGRPYSLEQLATIYRRVALFDLRFSKAVAMTKPFLGGLFEGAAAPGPTRPEQVPAPPPGVAGPAAITL